jgi:WD40 repeat protein
VCFSTDNKRVISGSNDMTIKIWNLSNGLNIKTLLCNSNISSVCISADGNKIVSSEEKSIKIWNT